MNDIGVIHLSNGGFALVDAGDFERLNRHGWCKTANGYAATGTRKGPHTWVGMHRLIMGATDGQRVDHANQVKLDNRKCNLRFATSRQNAANVNKRTGTVSIYKGVTWDKNRSKWKAGIKDNYRFVNLGRFDHEADAAEAYNRAAIEQWGEFAVLNRITPEHASFRRNARRCAFKTSCVTGEAE